MILHVSITEIGPEVRYFDIHEDDDLDEDQLVSWIEPASNLPGEKM